MRLPSWVGGLWVVVPGLVWAGSDVLGIPGECEMRVVSVEVPQAPLQLPSLAELSSTPMRDRWTFHAYAPAPNHQRAVFHLRDGVRVASLTPGDPGVVLRMDLLQHTPRSVTWNADSRWFALWASGPRKRAALVDAEHPERGATTVYDPEALDAFPDLAHAGERRLPFDLAWAPEGHALYVIERVLPTRGTQELGSAVVRLELEGTRVQSAREVLRLLEPLDFVSPAPHGAGDRLLYGTATGLFWFDARRGTRQLDTLPVVGLHNLAWHPTRDLVLLYFKRPTHTPSGEVRRGLYLVDLNQPQAVEQLHDRVDLHSVSWSPSGRYACWASPDEVAYRQPAAPPQATVYLECRTPRSGEYHEVKGFAWHGDEGRLAITAEDRLYRHTVGQPGVDEVLQLLPTRPEGSPLFLAEPCWSGDRVVLTAFEDRTRR